MNSTDKTSEKKDIRVTLSTLWIFALFNYLYCDVLGLMDPVSLKDLFAGNVGGIIITQEFLLSAAVLMEIPIAMVLLSRLLKYKLNRPANIIAGTIMTVVQISSLFFGTPPTTYYIFFSIIEIASLVLIVWYAWNWPKPEDN
jgi:hypothetical protein